MTNGNINVTKKSANEKYLTTHLLADITDAASSYFCYFSITSGAISEFSASIIILVLVTKNIGAIIIGYFISSNWVKDVFFIERLYKPKIRNS